MLEQIAFSCQKIRKLLPSLLQDIVMTQDNGVNISCIIPRNDQWNQKVREVNDCLICICENESISLIYHSISIDPRNNLNNSKLHLNFWGADKLRYNFI